MHTAGMHRHTFVATLALLTWAGCSESHSAPVDCGGVTCTAGEICCELPAREPRCAAASACAGYDAGLPVEDAGSSDFCGLPTGRMCPLGSFCEVGLGCGGSSGVCRPQPTVCDGEWAPVCGCDSVTYSNACLAQANGQSVSFVGVCEGPPPISACGTRGGITCGPDEVCFFEPGHCGRDDGGGSCVRRPDDCTGETGAVCGCDRVTYPSACAANQAGASVDLLGPCEPPSDCDADDVTITSRTCDAAGIRWTGYRCEAWDGCCVGADCDAGYASLDACEASHAECLRYCGGWSGPTCTADEFCDFEDDWCDWADGSGVCRPRPECPDPGGTPVCGCDGVTHPSLCEAQLSGVDAAYDGACTTP